jgi:hypothetical protein
LLAAELAGEAVDIEIFVGETADQGPRYVTISSAGGLGAFCEFLKTGSDEDVHGCLPQGADREQVEAEYCKDVPYLERESAPTKTAAPRYEATNSASPTPCEFLSSAVISRSLFLAPTFSVELPAD